METIHIIIGDMLDKMLPVIIKSYPINLIISLGKFTLESPLFDIQEIVEFDDYKSTIADIREIINLLRQKINPIISKQVSGKENQVYVCLTSDLSNETIIMNYLSQSLKSTAYYLKDSVLIELYPYRIEKLSPLENKVLDQIYQMKSIDSLKELLDIIKFDETDYPKATAKMGYIINKLARASFVTRSKDGRSVQVEITPQGKQFVLLFRNNSE
jgi:DNA-binding MarR family transcriptional regulator